MFRDDVKHDIYVPHHSWQEVVGVGGGYKVQDSNIRSQGWSLDSDLWFDLGKNSTLVKVRETNFFLLNVPENKWNTLWVNISLKHSVSTFL